MQIPDVDISFVNEGRVLDGPRVVVTKFGGLIDVRQKTALLYLPVWTTPPVELIFHERCAGPAI